MSNEPSQADARPASAHRSRPLAAALALFLGLLGAHRLYLSGRGWWAYPAVALTALGAGLSSDDWAHHPGTFVAALTVVVCAGEAIRIGLMPDASWDARFNPESGRTSRNGALPIWIAALALGLGAAVLMSVLSIAIEMAYRGAGVG